MSDDHLSARMAEIAVIIAQPQKWQRDVAEAVIDASRAMRKDMKLALTRAGLIRPIDAIIMGNSHIVGNPHDKIFNRPEGVTAEDDMAQLRAMLNSMRDWNDGHGIIVPTATADAFARLGLVEGYSAISDLPLIGGLPDGIPRPESPIWRHPDPADLRPHNPKPNRAARRRNKARK